MSDHLPPVTPRQTADGGLVYDGISYSMPLGYRPVLMDLHRPAAESPVPVVVWIHGGGFQSGDRRYLPETVAPGAIFDALTGAGLAVATIDYRHTAEAHFPAQVDDVNAAIAYLREYAEVLGLDAGRIGVWGESAGAALAAQTALTGSPVSAVVAWYPPTDMRTRRPADADTSEALLLGGPPTELPELAAEASPVTHVSAAAPPFLLIHGTGDTVVPPSHSERLHELLLKAGADSTYLPVPGAGHIFEGYDDVPGLIAASVDFLARRLLSS